MSKVTVLDGKCCGYGICVEICPEVFKLDDMGFAYVDSDEVSAEHEATAQEACDACPEDAIVID